MKKFYAIAKDGEEPHEYEIKFFGDKVNQKRVTNSGIGNIGFESYLKSATDADYDLEFRKTMYAIKPIYKVSHFLDYQLSCYQGEDYEFLAQIQYIILPNVRRGKPEHAKIIEKWLESKEVKKDNDGAHLIQIGDIHAPIQIQQNSNYSSQRQNIKYSETQIADFFSALREDIQKLDQSIREDFNIEINYAVKQLEKNNDIKPQLFNIGSLVTNVGLPIFTNLISSGTFEVIKPFIGIS